MSQKVLFKIINPCGTSQKYNDLGEFLEMVLIYEKNLQKRAFLKENLNIWKNLQNGRFQKWGDKCDKCD
jgi:7,8-dihydro-6-hydroxymethylpterin-pyrophosphokinase